MPRPTRKTEMNTRLNLMISFMAAPTFRSLALRRRLRRVGCGWRRFCRVDCGWRRFCRVDNGRRLRQVLFREEDGIPLGVEPHVRDHGLAKLRVLGSRAHALDQRAAQLGRALEPRLDILVDEVS